MTLDEFLMLYVGARERDIGAIQKSLISKGLAEKDLFYEGKLVVSNNTRNIISDIVVESSESPDYSDKFYTELALELKELYPKGKKEGTSYMWRGTTMEIVKKLKTLVVKYNYTLNKEDILDATREYVSSFNGNYRYMSLLKYFILKSKTDADGNIEVKSELMSLVENKGQTEEQREDWIGTLA